MRNMWNSLFRVWFLLVYLYKLLHLIASGSAFLHLKIHMEFHFLCLSVSADMKFSFSQIFENAMWTCSGNGYLRVLSQHYEYLCSMLIICCSRIAGKLGFIVVGKFLNNFKHTVEFLYRLSLLINLGLLWSW